MEPYTIYFYYTFYYILQYFETILGILKSAVIASLKLATRLTKVNLKHNFHQTEF